MLETSQDLLYVVLAFCIFWISIWFSWILYQTARTIKQVNDTISTVKNIVDNVQNVTEVFKNKAQNAGAFMSVLLQAGQELVKTVYKNKKEKNSSKKSAKK